MGRTGSSRENIMARTSSYSFQNCTYHLWVDRTEWPVLAKWLLVAGSQRFSYKLHDTVELCLVTILWSLSRNSIPLETLSLKTWLEDKLRSLWKGCVFLLQLKKTVLWLVTNNTRSHQSSSDSWKMKKISTYLSHDFGSYVMSFYPERNCQEA